MTITTALVTDDPAATWAMMRDWIEERLPAWIERKGAGVLPGRDDRRH